MAVERGDGRKAAAAALSLCCVSRGTWNPAGRDEETARTRTWAGSMSASRQALPERRCDRIVNRDVELGLEGLTRPAPRIFVHTIATASPPARPTARAMPTMSRSATSAKAKLSCRPQWRSAEQIKPASRRLSMMFDLRRLDKGVTSPTRETPARSEDLPEGQDRGAGRDSCRRDDALTKPFVALEAEPARRSPVPRDDLDPRIGEQLGRSPDLVLGELLVGGRCERDLGDLEAAEVRRTLRRPDNIAVVIGSRPFRRGRQHSKSNGFRNFHHPLGQIELRRPQIDSLRL